MECFITGQQRRFKAMPGQRKRWNDQSMDPFFYLTFSVACSAG